MLKKLFNLFKKPVETPKEDPRIEQIQQFRKEFKKYINTQEGGNIPGVILRSGNLFIEKSNKENK
jgi:hypothetical protein